MTTDNLSGDATRSVHLERVSEKHYRATNPQGASVDFGQGEGLLSPVELLLAAIAGCSSIDVDVVTSRRSEPTTFEVEATAQKVVENGANRVDDIRLTFKLAFPDDAAGAQATSMIENLVRLSHDKYCTVSRTVEHGASVTSQIEAN